MKQIVGIRYSDNFFQKNVFVFVVFGQLLLLVFGTFDLFELAYFRILNTGKCLQYQQ